MFWSVGITNILKKNIELIQLFSIILNGQKIYFYSSAMLDNISRIFIHYWLIGWLHTEFDFEKSC